MMLRRSSSRPGPKGFPFETLIGQRFGRLIVKEITYREHGERTIARCQCDCGAITSPAARFLRSGKTLSCGCLRADRLSAVSSVIHKTHGHYTGYKQSRTYITWRSMIKRCYDQRDKSYPRYGAIGISITKPWRDSFTSFLNDMGERPADMTIDRIDNRFGYFLSNCRWATPTQQNENRRESYEKLFPKLKLLLDARV